jgi:SNF2 family DNA or RNA helicase
MTKTDEMPVKAKLYKHQIKGVELCMKNNGFGLLFDVGLGKSLTAVAVAGLRHLKNDVNRVLVICPLAVVPVWEREFSYLTIDYNCFALEGSCRKKADIIQHLPKKGLQILVINYESARLLVKELMCWKPEMLIVDESQRIKNRKSDQAKAIHKLADICNYRQILTATPIGNGVEDIFSQWRVIDKQIFGSSFYVFRASYLIMGGYAGKVVVGTKNMTELVEKMHQSSLRITKEEALDLPEQIFETRYCELDTKAMNSYISLKRECVAQIQSGEVTARNILTRFTKLQQCADGFLKADDSKTYEITSTAKLCLMFETVEEVLAGGEKVVIFARFTAEINEIARRMEQAGMVALTLTGKTKNKGDTVKQFQENEAIKVLICQIKVGGVGITLTAASVVIFYSLSFSLIDYLQAIGRTHRIGQKLRCLYLFLVAKNTIDEYILAAVKDKRDFAETVVDHWQQIAGG